VFTNSLFLSQKRALVQQRKASEHSEQDQQQTDSALFGQDKINIPEIDQTVAAYLPIRDFLNLRSASLTLATNLNKDCGEVSQYCGKLRIGGLLHTRTQTVALSGSRLPQNRIKCSNQFMLIHYSAPETLGIQNLESNQTQHLRTGQDQITAAEILSNNRLVTLSENGAIKVWDLTRRIELTQLPWRDIAYPPVSFQITPDQTRIIMCSRSGSADVVDLATATTLHTLPVGIEGHIATLILDDSNVALTFCNLNSKIKVWDLSTGEELATFAGHKYLIKSVLKTSDERIVSCSAAGGIKVWNWKTGKVLHTLAKEGSSEILQASITLNDQLVICSVDLETDEETIRTWDLKKRRLGSD
jgi:hypothetical protein